MSRLPSLDVPGAYYYLQLQGNGNSQNKLLSSREDFATLIQLLESLEQETGARLLGYCLFQDSLHFVVRSGDQGVLAAAQWLINTHTQAYNQHQRRNGSLYSQRIIATLIDPHHYLLPVMHSLHWLPVRAGLVSTPMAYPWSSHRHYLATDCPAWLDRDDVLIRVANHRASQLRRFEHFIDNSRPAPLDWEEGINSRYRALADDSYVAALMASAKDNQGLPVLDLDGLTEWICSEYGLEEKDLLVWRNHRLSVEVQAVVGFLAKLFKVASVNAVANYFRCDSDVLIAGIRAMEARRGMYLYKLQLRLEQWLNTHVQVNNNDADDSEITDFQSAVTDVDNGEDDSVLNAVQPSRRSTQTKISTAHNI